MKYKRALIIIGTILFFITATTFYLNRVIFPRVVKKIVVERLEKILKRKVEIGTLHFNWVRGFIIDKIKIYEKAPDQDVFAQADQVAFGVLFFPTFKYLKVTIPFINVRSPSVHLVHLGTDSWNFSDMYASPAPATPALTTAPASGKAPRLEIAWGGLSISDGQLLVDDVSTPRKWSEYFDNINLKLSLSYKGISYDFTADIPGKHGFIGASVYYQPITKNTEAHIRLKNIDTASYFSWANVPDVHLDSGIIKDIDLTINHTQDETSAQGDVFMKGLDISGNQQTFKGDIEMRGLDARYHGGDITARGQVALDGMQTSAPGIFASGSVQARVNDFEMTRQGINFLGSLHARDVLLNLKGRQVQLGAAALDDIRVRKNDSGVQSTGSIITQGLVVQWPQQSLQGDIALKGFTMRMKDGNDIHLEGDLQADNFSTSLNNKSFSGSHLLFQDAQLEILDQKNVVLNTGLSVDDMSLELPHNDLLTGSIETDKLLFDLDDESIKVSTTLDISKARLDLGHHKTIEGDPQLELHLQIPLNHPQEPAYKGSITLSDGIARGFDPIRYLDNIQLDADFQNDEVTINALNANILDTDVRVNGTVKNFQHPFLNILAEADELDLSKIRALAPRLVDQYGLSFDGTSYLKVKFEGLASDPLSGNILAVASVKNASVYSSKLHQHLKNITGIVEATPDSLKWRDFTAAYLDKKYRLAGSLVDFKDPKIFFTIDGPQLQLKADLAKRHDRLTINDLTGKYLNAAFDSKGSIIFPPGKQPFFNINTEVSLLLEDLIKTLPVQQQKILRTLNPSGAIGVTANLKGSGLDWKNYIPNAEITSPLVTMMGYSLHEMKIEITQEQDKLKSFTFNGKLYDGTVHGVGSLDLNSPAMPYDLALNIDGCDLHKLKMDSPLKMEEIDGKFYLTTVAHGTITDFKDNLRASGALAIRDGFLAQFNLFKGLLSILNDVLRLGQVEITDVEGNFTVANQKINTDNLRLKSPTIVLLTRGWVNFDQICDLDVTVDLSSGVIPDIAHDVLSSLNIRIYDKIADPKFKKKISVPEVINTLLKNLWQ